jgi:MFS transporter, UMF1 family
MTAAPTTAENAPQTPEERLYRRRIFSWSLYDVADHAYITTTASTFFSPYLIAVAAPILLAAGASSSDEAAMALARDTASNIFALVVSLSLLISAVIAPVIGTYADITGRRKRILVIATVVGGIFASLMATIVTGTWVWGLALYVITQIALNIALGLNSALLPHITLPADMNRVSSLGYAMGYFGGGILLAANTALYLFADKLGIDGSTAVQIAFFTVGVWWIGFMIPLARNVPEPAPTPLANGSGNPVRDAFTRLSHTIRDIRRYGELFKMLIAFWLYSEGIGAIILLATAYGAALGLDTSTLISTLLMTQFVAFPYAILYGRIPNAASKWRSAYVSMLIWTGITMPLMGIYANLNPDTSIATTFTLIAGNQVLGGLFSIFIGRRLFAGFTARLTTKRAIILGLVIYTLIPVWGFFLHSKAEFFMIGWLVGTVQGGTQALSRSLYTRLSPAAKSGEFFGLYGLSEKFAGLIGPLLYALVGTLTHSPQASVLSISVFFVIGIILLGRVDEESGAKIATAEEAAIETVRAAD